MPKKVLTGKVVSNKMEKTIVVAVQNRVPHIKYAKPVLKTKKFKAHDENNECKEGDIVEIIENVPISKTKKWMLKEIIAKGE